MKKLIIGLIIAAVIIAGCGIAFGIYFNSPKYILSQSVNNALEDLCERDEIEPLVKALSGGSLEVSVDGIKDEPNASLTGKLYFGDDAIMLDNLKIEDDEIGKIELDAYISKNLSYVTSEEILEGTYGIIKGDMSSAFESSIFAYGKNSRYSVSSKELHDMIVTLLSIYDNGDEFEKDIKKLEKRYSKDIWKAICRYGEFDSEWKKVRVGGERISAKVIKLKLDGDSMSDIVNTIYEKACDDDKLYELIEDISDIIGNINGKTLIDVFDEEFIKDKSRTIEKFIEELEDSDTEYTIEIVTPRFGTKLLKLSFIEDNGKTENEFTLELGKKGIKKTDKISISVNDNELTYKIKENDKDVYKAYLELNGEEFISLNVNKKREKYTLEISSVGNVAGYGTTMMVSGEYVYDSKTITVSVERIEENKDVIFEGNITFILREKDNMPEPLSENDVTNILNISNGDIEKWIINLGKLKGDQSTAIERGIIKPNSSASVTRKNLENAGYRVTTPEEYQIFMFGDNVKEAIFADDSETWMGSYNHYIYVIYYDTEEEAQTAFEDAEYYFQRSGTYAKVSGKMIYVGDAEAIIAASGR